MDKDGEAPGETITATGRPETLAAPASRTRIARYELVEQLGAGGMGVVWAARDPALDRSVAIKLLFRNAMYPDAGNRLLREGQAMAKLSHSAVVPVFDVGREDDQLFIVMELVDGENLRAALQARRRSWREVVEMFVRAGRGLAAAHDAGIVHRDFKPDNVLVGRDGTVRVTDFGLARIEAADEAAGDAPAVRAVGSGPPEAGTSAVSGTPRYMAPEQRRGAPSARSDQFSFCVALWEALYQRAPYDDAPDAPRPEPPAGARAPAWLARILVRGLARDPAERWPSMTALLDAIERVPRRRRRLALATAGLAGAAAVAAVAVTVTSRPAAAVDLCVGFDARMAGVWDEPVRERVADSFRKTGAPRVEEILRRLDLALGARARGWIEARTETCRAAVRGELSPQLAAARVECLDRQRDELGALTRLLAAADPGIVGRALVAADETGRAAACARAAPLLAGATGDPATPEVEAIRARVVEATVQRKLGRIAEAGAGLAKAADEAAAAGALALAGQAALQLAVAQTSSRPADAEETLRRALRLAGQARDDVLLARALLYSIFFTGTVRARHDEALALRPLAEAAIARAGDDPSLTYSLHHYVGVVLAHADRPDEARTELEQALAIEERAPDSTVASLLTTLNSLGNLAEERGDFDRARALFERARAAVEQREGPDSPLVAYPTNSLGTIAYRQGRHEDALALYRRALALFEASLPPGSAQLAIPLENVGLVLHILRGPDEALPLYQRSLALREAAHGHEHPRVAQTLVNLAGLHAEAGRSAEARAAAERAVAIRQKAYGPDHLMLASALTQRALVQLEAGIPRDALRDATEALAIFERTNRADHPGTAEPLIALGRGHLATGAPRAAVAPLERATRLKAKLAPELWAQATFLLGRALWDSRGDRPRALVLAREAHAALVAAGPAGAPWTERAAAWLAERK